MRKSNLVMTTIYKHHIMTHEYWINGMLFSDNLPKGILSFDELSIFMSNEVQFNGYLIYHKTPNLTKFWTENARLIKVVRWNCKTFLFSFFFIMFFIIILIFLPLSLVKRYFLCFSTDPVQT